jgi:uncharacterized protein YggE
MTVRVASTAYVGLMDAIMTKHWPWIFINGTTTTREPDVKGLMLSVSSEAATGKEAAALNTDRMRILADLVKATAGADSVTKSDPVWTLTSSLNRMPGARDDDETRSEPEYRAHSELIVHLATLDKAAEAVDAAERGGASRLERITFDSRDFNRARDEAIHGATKDAQQKAQSEAAALKVELGALVKSDIANAPAEDSPSSVADDTGTASGRLW